MKSRECRSVAEFASRSEETNHKGRHLILNIELVELTLARLPKGLWLPRGVVRHRDIVSEYLYIFYISLPNSHQHNRKKSYERL